MSATKGFQNDNRASIGATRESLWNIMTQIRKDETYVVSNAPTVTVSDQVHMWPTKSPRTVGVRASIQGADASFDNTDTGRSSNFTQIFQVSYQLTGTRTSVDAVGSDPRSQERNEAMKDMKAAMEFAVIRGTLVSGNNTTAATMKGLKAFASTLATSQSGVTLTESIMNAYLANAWEQGVEVDTVLVGRVLKQRISGFTASNTKNIDVEAYKSVNRVDVYESDFGTVRIIKHRYVTISGDVNYDFVAYDSAYVRLGFLREPQFKSIASTGDYEAEMLVAEATLQVDTELAVVTGLRHL